MFILPWLLLATAAPAAESVILSADQTQAVTQQCARAVPQGIEGTWQLDQSDAEKLDVEVRHLPSQNVGDAIIRMPYTSERQYLGVVIGGKYLVYINGYPPGTMQALGGRTVVTCGRGSAYWGALYDPKTRQFSQFEANSSGR